jgi:hypothetical protein
MKRAYTIDEFGAAYGVGRVTIWKERKAGRLIARKFGPRKVLISVENAEAWAASRLTPDTVAP